MTDQLSPEMAALLEAARQNHGPTEHDRQRVLVTLHRSLGIGLPVALTATASAGLSGGQGAVSSGAGTLAGTQATGALPGVGAASSGVSGAQVAVSAAQGVTHVAPSAAKAGLGLFGKLITWKAGKLLLAGAALSSAVGIGASVVPRVLQDSPELDSKAGSATAFATATADAGRSTLPAPPPPSEQEPSAVAAAPLERALDREHDVARAQAVDDEAPPALAALPAVESPIVASAMRMPRGTTRGHHKHGKRVTIRSAPSHASRDKTVAAAVEPATPAAAQPATPTEVEAPHELTLIRRALTSLRDGQPAQALAQLDEHAARFPTGSFSTERRGLHVVALCEAGRTDEGERERAAFLKSSASSPIAARVRSACNERDD